MVLESIVWVRLEKETVNGLNDNGKKHWRWSKEEDEEAGLDCFSVRKGYGGELCGIRPELFWFEKSDQSTFLILIAFHFGLETCPKRRGGGVGIITND